MFEKFFAKYHKETKVKADKFADTLNRVTSPISKDNSKDGKIKITSNSVSVNKSIPPMDENYSSPKVNKNQSSDISNQFQSELSNLFGNSSKIDSEPENKNFAEDYCKNVIEAVLKQIKGDLAPFGRDVKVNVNSILLLGSASVMSQGRTEYEYSIKLNKGANSDKTTITVKESGLRGGWDVRASLSNLKMSEVNKEDYSKDFLDGYKRYIKAKGWV